MLEGLVFTSKSFVYLNKVQLHTFSKYRLNTSEAMLPLQN